MTLNANYSGARVMSGRQKLDGPERGLDGLVGLVILVAEILIGFLAISSLYEFGQDILSGNPNAYSDVQGGFLVALVAGVGFVGVTTLIYLARLAQGRRSWGAPLWGLILLTASTFVGWTIMSNGF